MKSVWTVAAALLLLSAAAFAAPAPAPNPAPLSDAALAAILDGGSSCAKAKPAAHGSAVTFKGTCTATANCQGGGTVNCTGNTPCSFVDGDCSILEAGHVTCGGVSTYCTPACCSTGTMHDKACCRCEATGGCQDCCRCDGGTIAQCALQCG